MFPPNRPRARAHLWSGRRPNRTSDGSIAKSALRVIRATNVPTDRLMYHIIHLVSEVQNVSSYGVKGMPVPKRN